MTVRVRFVTGRSVPYGAPSQVRKKRRKGGPTCACGRKFGINRKSPIPPHKNEAGRWCEYATQPGQRAKTGADGTGSTSSRRKSGKTPGVDDVGVSRKGQLQCATCLKWLDAPTGELPVHQGRPNPRTCRGGPAARREVPAKKGQQSTRKSSKSRSVQNDRTGRPRNDRHVRLTPEQRRERAIARKIEDRIELQMAELEERPPREDIEFGPGRDPRVSGGLSETRRSRY